MFGCREGSPGTVRPRQCLGSCCIIDQTAGCEWPLPRSQWLSTGCEISAATTSALFPLQLDAIYSPNPDLPSGKSKKKKKKHSHTREKSTCKPLRALRIKHTDLKVLLSRTFSPSFPPPRCSTGGSFALRRSPTELLAWFNASCSGAKKHGIYVLAPLSCFFFFFFFFFAKVRCGSETFFFPQWTFYRRFPRLSRRCRGSKTLLKLDLYHLDGG